MLSPRFKVKLSKIVRIELKLFMFLEWIHKRITVYYSKPDPNNITVLIQIKNRMLMCSANFKIKLTKNERMELEIFIFKSEHIKESPVLSANT